MTENGGVDFIGFPLDPKESPQTLKSYEEQNDLLTDLPDAARAQTYQGLPQLMDAQEVPLPATVITESQDRVVWYCAGAPAGSEVRKLFEDGN